MGWSFMAAMKTAHLQISWPQGLHLRPAGQLVALARAFQSSIRIRAQERVADARSVVSLLLLCATLGTVLEIEVAGDDEDAALAAVMSVFQSDPDSREASPPSLATEETTRNSG